MALKKTGAENIISTWNEFQFPAPISKYNILELDV